jgi:hypothetical protein
VLLDRINTAARSNVTHSYRNRSQIKTTFDFAETVKTPAYYRIYEKLVNSVQVAKTHLSFATAFFYISEPNKGAQRDLKIIVWVEYFPYKYSFKVVSND